MKDEQHLAHITSQEEPLKNPTLGENQDAPPKDVINEDTSLTNEQSLVEIPRADDCVYIPEEVYENLPEILRTCTNLFVGRERDIILLASFGALSAVLPNIYGVYKGQKVYSNIYVLIVAPPASGKGVMNFAKLLVAPIHKMLYTESLASAKSCEEDNKKNKTDDECPPIKTKLIPGNISSAEFYAMINNAEHGALMFESEADTLSVVLKQDYGNFSDALRKAFHHEELSISRKTDKLYLEINEPQLSVVISGTEDQIAPLVKSKENGLFSRFIYYAFNDAESWKDVFSFDNSQKQIFTNIGVERIYKIYSTLRSRTQPVELILSEIQKQRFNTEMEKINNIVVEHHHPLFISSVRRHGLIFFRFLLIISALREEERLNTIYTLDVRDEDFDTMLKLTKALLRHALYIFKTVDSTGLNDVDDEILYSLPEIFTRDNAVIEGDKMRLSPRTIDYKLKQWLAKKIIKKIKHGTYKRM